MIEGVIASGEGEPLSEGREYLLKAAHPDLSVFVRVELPAGQGAAPHVHERHADCFYVLEGELDVHVAGGSVRLPAGGLVLAPPGVVHGFSLASPPGRHLNIHAPDGGFAESRRARRDGREPREPFDVLDPPAGGGLPASEAVVRMPGEGERLSEEHRELLVKAVRPELDVLEYDVGPGYEGPGPHYHERHVDSFYVLAGELEFSLGDEIVRAPAGTFVLVRPGTVHAFTNPGPGGARFLNVHAPETGFVEYLRARDRGDDPDPERFDVHDVSR